jgi:Coenzyme PQQ synthesis protein D (PqqD)
MLDRDTLKLVKPRARTGLVTRPVGDEVVVYDPETHAAHCLNRTAAIIFGLVDGGTDVDVIAKRFAVQTGTEIDNFIVWNTLDQLAEAKLLELGPSHPAAVSRRRVLRRVGLGAAALGPIVASLVVPTPAEAAATCLQQPACDLTTIGNNCYVLSPQECPSKVCTGVGVCS